MAVVRLLVLSAFVCEFGCGFALSGARGVSPPGRLRSDFGWKGRVMGEDLQKAR